MKNIWKSYRGFLPAAYRLIGLLIVPVLTGIVMELFLHANPSAEMVSVLLANLVIYEVVADHWLFGTICVKAGPRMDFLRTSVAGDTVLRNALMGDGMRRALYLGVFVGVAAVQVQSVHLLAMGLLADSCITATLVILRHTMLPVLVQFGVGGLAAGVFAIGNGICGLLAQAGMQVLEISFWAVVCIGINVFAVWHAMHGMRIGKGVLE